MTQLTLNVKVSDTIKTTSFFANFDKELNLFDNERTHRSAQATMKRIKTMKRVHDNIKNMQKRFANYQNKKRKMTPQLKKKNKIYLLTKNLKTRKKSRKLNHIKIESFFIKNQRGRVSYELNLSRDVKVHLVFHLSLLKSVDSQTSI